MNNEITLSTTTLDRLSHLVKEALTTDCNDTRHDCLCEADRLLNPGDWRTLTAEESIAAAGDQPQEQDLIKLLCDSKAVTEAEALTTGQLHAQRLLQQTPDWDLLVQMMAAIQAYDESGLLDLGGILDDEFKADLLAYPTHLQHKVFAGFFEEVADIYQAVVLLDEIGNA